jgi:hypothetical protein
MILISGLLENEEDLLFVLSHPFYHKVHSFHQQITFYQTVAALLKHTLIF